MKKRPIDPGEVFALLWFFILQPALFLFGITVFLHGVYQSVWG